MLKTLFGPIVRAMCSLAAVAASAQAGFVASTVTIHRMYPAQNVLTETAGTQIIDAAGTTFSLHSIDYFVADDAIRISSPYSTMFSGAGFNGIRLTASGAPAITAVEIDPASNVAGLDASRIWFDSQTVFINMQGLSLGREVDARLDVTFEQGMSAPEPYAALLVGGALLAFFVLRRWMIVAPGRKPRLAAVRISRRPRG